MATDNKGFLETPGPAREPGPQADKGTLWDRLSYWRDMRHDGAVALLHLPTAQEYRTWARAPEAELQALNVAARPAWEAFQAQLPAARAAYREGREAPQEYRPAVLAAYHEAQALAPHWAPQAPSRPDSVAAQDRAEPGTPAPASHGHILAPGLPVEAQALIQRHFATVSAPAADVAPPPASGQRLWAGHALSPEEVGRLRAHTQTVLDRGAAPPAPTVEAPSLSEGRER